MFKTLKIGMGKFLYLLCKYLPSSYSPLGRWGGGNAKCYWQNDSQELWEKCQY